MEYKMQKIYDCWFSSFDEETNEAGGLYLGHLFAKDLDDAQAKIFASGYSPLEVIVVERTGEGPCRP